MRKRKHVSVIERMREWEDSFEGIAYEWDPLIASLQVKRWCLIVLERMPRKARREFLDRCAETVWVPPGTSCTFPISLPVVYAPLEEIDLAGSGRTEPNEDPTPMPSVKQVVVLQADLPDVPEDQVIAIIAHEFAHVVCDHRPLDPKVSEDERESEADRVASSWGFDSEIKSLRSGGHGTG